MKGYKFWVVQTTLLLTCGVAPAAKSITVTLQDDADADIRSGDLENNSYNRTGLPVGNETTTVIPGSSSTRNYKAYIRFALPHNIATLNSANFTISRADPGAWLFSIYAFGLNDGVPGEADWIEANTGGITWNTAPGNDITSPSLFDPNASTPIGSFTTTGYNYGGTAGDSYSIGGDETTNPEMLDFIKADTNGFITIMLGRVGGISSSSDQFVARTGTGPAYPGIPAPTLTLDYTPTAGIAGDYNNDGKVDAADYVIWRANNGSNNALANDNGLGTPIGTAHYNLWRSNFGKTAGAGSGLTEAATPEPSAIVLMLTGVVSVLGISNRARRKT